MSDSLPTGWADAMLQEICDVNPRHPKNTDREQMVSFVPMPAVSDILGVIQDHELRPLNEVWKGYTHFRDGDVIFAKITPCMENGKIAVASNLYNGLACGSTEFHVLRPHDGISAQLLWYFLRQKSFRREAERSMTGAVGQRRVPAQYLQETVFRVPPVSEQCRIVAKLDSLFARTLQVREELQNIPTLIGHYKQSILAAAFRGELTADWRNSRTEIEAATELVERIPVPQQPRGGREATDTVIEGRAALSVNAPERPAPEGWAWVPLLRITRQETGHTPSRKHPEYWDGNIPWIGIRDAGDHHGGVIMDTYQHVTEKGLANSSARLLPKDTVCLSRTASVGYVVRMGRDMATSQDFVTWTCSEAIDPDYLFYALLAEGDDIRRFGKGSTHTTIYFPEVRALHICLAPIEEQREIVNRVKTALHWVDSIAYEVSNATELLPHLESRLLGKAFRGELVPQNPDDEPTSILLERIRETHAE